MHPNRAFDLQSIIHRKLVRDLLSSLSRTAIKVRIFKQTKQTIVYTEIIFGCCCRIVNRPAPTVENSER